VQTPDLAYLQNIFNRLVGVTGTTTQGETRITEATDFSGIEPATRDQLKFIYRTIEKRLFEKGLLSKDYARQVNENLSETNNQPAPEPVPEPVPSSSGLDLSMLEGFEPIKRTDRGGSVSKQQEDLDARLEEDPLYREKLKIYRLVNQPFKATGRLGKARQNAKIRKAIDAYNQAFALINQ